MRFELFLTQLPRAAPARIKATMAELPKGLSTGVILKTLETQQVPTVPVAWHDDKRVMNEIMDGLVELGAECRLIDHGNLFLRIGTFFAEHMGQDRYLDDDDAPKVKLVKLSHDDAPSLPEALLRHALIYLVQSGIVAVLFVWSIGLRVGMVGLNASQQLIGQLAGCVLGTLAAYVVCHSAEALRAGRMPRKLALTLFALCALPTLIAPLLLGKGFQKKQEAEIARIKRPPSYPFSGLLTELRRRKLADEIASTIRHSDEVEGDGLRRGQAEGAEAEAEAALSCLMPRASAEIAECAGGPDWARAAACLPAPIAAAQPRALAPTWADPRAAEATEVARPAPDTHAPATESAAKTVRQEQRVTFALRDVVSLLVICLLTSIGLAAYERWRRRKQTDATRDQGDNLSSGTRSSEAQLAAQKKAHAEALALTQEQHREEIAALRAQLEHAATSAPVATPSAKSSEDSQLIRITQELGLTRGALGASQTSINELREKLTSLTETQRKLEQEGMQRRAELVRANERYARAEAELSELRALAARQLPANDALTGAAQTGVAARPTDLGAAGREQADEDASSYSVSSGQEERIVIPKRRR